MFLAMAQTASLVEKESMPTLGLGHSKPAGHLTLKIQRGFTLLELLVVLVVISIATGLIVVRGTPGDSRYLQAQSEKLSQILRIAQQEALLRSRTIRFSLLGDGFIFEQLENDRWVETEDEPLLRPRQWDNPDLTAIILNEGQRVPFLELTPRQGLANQQIILQLNNTRQTLNREFSGVFKASPAQQVTERLAAGGSRP